jgi:hypothetical protein
MSKMLRACIFLLLCIPAGVMAQVTTGTITGTVKTAAGEVLPGATITALHQPTGTKYSTMAKINGQFTLANLRVGGPYQVTIHFQGFSDGVYNDLTVTLGTPLSIDAALDVSSSTLTEVKVTASRKGSVISSQRNGTSTYISPRLMQSVPTINRSVQDFARLTPQASAITGNADGSSLGVSFAGQNNRYNQFSIDGANGTDGFGLTSSGTNGGQANINPISIEAIQEMQIVLSPYDVTQGGFTGGGINAVTKSGTNDFHGSVYGVYQNQGYVAKSVPNKNGNGLVAPRLNYQDFKNTTYGASLGGAIVKNKLFFFVAAERFEKTNPLAFDPTIQGSGSFANKDTLESIRQFLINTYEFDPGSYGAIVKENSSTSLFGRIDWNINDHNKLTVRHSYVHGSNDIISRTASSIVFSNGGYQFVNTTNSTVAELNSTFKSGATNVLRTVLNVVNDARETAQFPSLTILNTGVTYNLGSDLSSQVNTLDQTIVTLTDNLTLYKNRHTITVGTNNELYITKNNFLQNYFGSYTYGSSTTNTGFAAFKNNSAGPANYSVSYSVKGGDDKATAIMRAAQLGFYAQDVYAINSRFKLTYGIRVDLPVYFSKPSVNSSFENDPIFASFGVKTQQMPKVNPLFAPRVGFNWDVKGDATTQLRGGAGLFTGRIPFVWISNQFSNTGVTNINFSASNTTNPALSTIRFNYNPNDTHMGSQVPSNTTVPPTVINVIDKKFKYPQVFRANFAVDQKLPVWGLVGTFEAVFTKTVNNANYQNLNLTYFPDSTVTLGQGVTRPLWTRRLTNAYTDVVLLTNTSKGYGYNLTAQVTKPYSRGWSGMIAYTYGRSTSLSDLTSSVAYSNWRFAYSTNGLNYLDLANSNFDMGSRVVGYITREFKYANNKLATSFTLIYTGQSGQRISYLYSRDITGDDQSNLNVSNSIVYIPKNAAEANFVNLSRTVNGVNTTVTPAQQWADFQGFVLNNKYLKDHIGRNTARNGDRLPFENHFDLRIAQDIFFAKNNKLQIYFDILNISNLLNKDWGWSYNLANQSINLFNVQNTNTAPAVGTPTRPALQFDITRMGSAGGVYRPYFVSDFTSRWNSQIGLRYSF